MHVHAGKAKAWAFFQRLCTLNKADVYQYSVMLNACNDSFAAEALIGRMEAAGVQVHIDLLGTYRPARYI